MLGQPDRNNEDWSPNQHLYPSAVNPHRSTLPASPTDYNGPSFPAWLDEVDDDAINYAGIPRDFRNRSVSSVDDLNYNEVPREHDYLKETTMPRFTYANPDEIRPPFQVYEQPLHNTNPSHYPSYEARSLDRPYPTFRDEPKDYDRVMRNTPSHNSAGNAESYVALPKIMTKNHPFQYPPTPIPESLCSPNYSEPSPTASFAGPSHASGQMIPHCQSTSPSEGMFHTFRQPLHQHRLSQPNVFTPKMKFEGSHFDPSLSVNSMNGAGRFADPYGGGYRQEPTMSLQHLHVGHPTHRASFSGNLPNRPSAASSMSAPPLHTVGRRRAQSSAGSKVYECDHIGCGKSFSMPHLLRNHLIWHSDARPYQCPHCKASFKRNCDMNRHIKSTHLHVSRRFACHECQMTWNRVDRYNAHMRTAHSQEMPRKPSSTSSSVPQSPEPSMLHFQPAPALPPHPQIKEESGE